MADYYPLIVKAVSGLEKSSGEARRDLYDRARKALLAQLRGVEPALSEPDITRERLALEEAIRKVEAEAARRSRNDPLPPRPDSSRPDPKRPDDSKASRVEASKPAASGPEIARPDATVRSEPPLRPARQTVIPERPDAAEVRSPSAGRPAAPLSAAAVKTILPPGDAEDEAARVPEATGGAKPATVERTRWTPGNGPSISDKGLKGFRDIFGDGETPSEAPDLIKTLAGQGAPNGAVEAAEPRRDSRSEKRSQSRAQPLSARVADPPMEPRTDARADKRTGRGPDRAIDRGAEEPADRWTAARMETRINGRSDPRLEPRVEPRPDSMRPPPRKDTRAEFLRGDMPAEPPVEPPPSRPPSRRLSARDAERIGREPVAEPRANREALEPRRMREPDPPRFPDEFPADETDADEADLAGRAEYPTHAPSSIVRQEDGRRRTAAPRAVKPERQPGPARRASAAAGQWRKFAALAIIGLLLMTIAAVAVWKREQLLSPFRGLPVNRVADNAAPGEGAKGTKITDRVGALQTATQSTADNALVAQKVVLYEEDQNDPAGKRYVGSAVWHTDQVAPAPGKPPEVTVRADIEIPEQRLGLRWSLRRNDDKALPASHTVEIMFSVPADFLHGSISNIPGVLMKQGESTRGVPLAGLAVKVTNNFFLIGLSSVEADMQRNIQLLKERSWFDIPVVYGDGKRAIIAIEKGTPGDRAFNDAFAAWGQ